jgi:hypothetical protein
MQETWKFVNLKAPEATNQALTPWLQDLLEQHSKEMGIFLSYYFRKEGAVVENVKMVPPTTPLTDSTGSINVSFHLIHFNACLNIHDTNTEHITLSYKVLDNGTELLLSGPNWPEREPDEI